MFQQDYIMRQIRNMARMIGLLLFGWDLEEPILLEEVAAGDGDPLRARLLDLLGTRQVNAAEDLLFEAMEPGNPSHTRIALAFYERLNGWTDEALEAAGFSREEVRQGLAELARQWGIPVFSE
jgi:hypothetical protein